ncbi:hypothetical protein B0H17DRAFT_1143873 [Mycena rosella]|uniref:Uncharacterized protein n=1 Tax=Mycena rosella TaxID=1033263 RepID=A0AAD7CU19_MYCRO|nr:hypothetical protein B0H17DRAFT_1143873 [Mycena rosella]
MTHKRLETETIGALFQTWEQHFTGKLWVGSGMDLSNSRKTRDFKLGSFESNVEKREMPGYYPYYFLNNHRTASEPCTAFFSVLTPVGRFNPNITIRSPFSAVNPSSAVQDDMDGFMQHQGGIRIKFRIWGRGWHIKPASGRVEEPQNGGVEDLQGQKGVGQGFEGSENYKLTSEIDRLAGLGSCLSGDGEAAHDSEAWPGPRGGNHLLCMEGPGEGGPEEGGPEEGGPEEGWKKTFQPYIRFSNPNSLLCNTNNFIMHKYKSRDTGYPMSRASNAWPHEDNSDLRKTTFHTSSRIIALTSDLPGYRWMLPLGPNGMGLEIHNRASQKPVNGKSHLVYEKKMIGV